MSWSALPGPLSCVSQSFGVGLILAVDEDDCLMIDADGQLLSLPWAEVRVDLRFDSDREKWIDISEIANANEEEAPDDGRAPVPGDFPDTDRTDGSDPGHPEDGAIRDLVPGEATR